MNVAVKGELRHRMLGRIRVALDHPLPARDELERLAAALAAVEGVQEVEIRPHSGSIVVRHGRDYDDASKALGRAGLHIEIKDHAPHRPADPIGETVERLSLANATIQRWTGGRADIWNIAFSAIVTGGLIQLARGRVAGPALTLFAQAATLAMSRPPHRTLG